jgi:carbamoyl-phosphate synthase large subunit
MQIGVNVIVADKDKVDICNDKWKTYVFLKENGFDAPVTFLNLEDAREAIANGKMNFPVMVKPRWGMGSLAVYEAENEEELEIFYKKSYRNIMKSYLKYEAVQDDKACVLIQEKISGQEYGMDVINDLDGNYRHAVVKMKYAMRSGETDCAVTVEREDIRDIGARLSRLLKHRGNLDVDILMRGETPCVLEMNARFGGGYPFSHMAGVNLPQAIVNWLKGENVPDSLLKEESGVSAHKDIVLVKMNLDEV